MRKYLYICIFFASCTSNFNLKDGDFLFQDLDSSELCEAIEAVTEGYKGSNLSHVGLVTKQNNEVLVICAAVSDGRPDRLHPKSDVGGFKSSELTFREHEFNMENLPPFKYYRIKFLLTSTNQVYVPRVSNLRVITLA